MIQVKFINQNNEIFKMNYSEVLTFCKMICLKEKNHEQFEIFQKNYTFFEPYFDFVTFQLNYVFCVGDYTLCYYPNPNIVGDALYDVATRSNDYKKIKKYVAEMIKLHMENFPPIQITKCSDYDLNLQKIENIPKKSFLVDGNLFGYISKVGDEQGSHTITANTLFNQFLIQNPIHIKNIEEYVHRIGYLSEGTSLNYLVTNLGFIRMTQYSLVYNKIVLNEKQKHLIEKAEKECLIVEDMDSDVINENTRRR